MFPLKKEEQLSHNITTELQHITIERFINKSLLVLEIDGKTQKPRTRT
jgi:hypothetical protein